MNKVSRSCSCGAHVVLHYDRARAVLYTNVLVHMYSASFVG